MLFTIFSVIGEKKIYRDYKLPNLDFQFAFLASNIIRKGIGREIII